MSSTASRTPLVVLLTLLATSCAAQGPSPSAGAGGARVQPGATLVGTVGNAEDSEAYEISLTTSDARPVEVVAAGTYTLVVEDFAQVHTFRLSGAGVDATLTSQAPGGRRSR